VSSRLLSEAGELGLLAELERRGLVTAIEHDAAQLGGGLVVTQDGLVQGVHFRLDWTSWRDLGWKAAAVNLSDLAASGAVAEALIVTLGLPAETPIADVVELYEGMAETGVPVRGGDTTVSDRVVLSVTAIGHAERVPGRAGAQPGDLLVVTGQLGGSGAGFRALEEGRRDDPHVRAHLRPPLRLEEGRRLARVASAMLDLSDGLAVDPGHLARRSGVRVVIDLDRVPRVGEIADLGFGEDYELLAATSEPLEFPVIGRCEVGEGVDLRLDGREIELSGWEHFR
jgi:thiamine-monophosphate kinase